MNEILNFRSDGDKLPDVYWDRFEELGRKCEEIKRRAHFSYMMSLMFIQKAKESGKINEEERRILRDKIKVETNTTREPREDAEIYEAMKR